MGKVIVIEGSDGSLKATQTALLYEYLKAAGRQVRMVTYPNYDSPSSSLAVSYTHLDVYKRQAISFGEGQIPFEPEISEWGNLAEQTSVVVW